MADVIKGEWWRTDNCDHCGPSTRPRVVFILKDGKGILMMCRHCSRVHASAIEQYLDEEIHAPVEVGGTGSSKGAP